jgi:lipopolysaccharide export system protein LptA
VQAPIIVFDRDARSVVANGTPDYRVSTVFMQTDRKGKDTPVHIISDQLRYYDSERRAHFEGKVVAKSEDATLTSDRTDVFWLPASSSSPGQKPTPGPSAAANSSESKGGGSTSSAGAGKQTNVSTTGISAGQGTNQEQGSGASSIDKIIADGSVVMTQPKRRGVGTHLTYTASDDRFVLVGNPPSIFDAEHGKVTGDSLTFYKRDDRVLVEGKSNSPAFTESRVAR